MGLKAEVENFYISYSDMVTLLFIFFVYLFSIAEINPVKLMEVSGAVKSNAKSQALSQAVAKLQVEQRRLEQMNKQMKQYIEKHNMQKVVDVKYKDGQLELNFGDTVLFEPGRANLKSEAIDVLSKLGELFKNSNSKIVVEGHTDDVPISSAQYPSNWELSSARSASVVRFLESKSIDGTRFTIVGYNQYSPLVPNTSAENRAKNRRVRITLKPDVQNIMKNVPKPKPA